MSDMKRSALAALIDDTEERNGWQDPDVVRQAAREGDKQLTSSDISLYRRVGMRTIVPGKMVDLARGLRVPPYLVAAAVLADHGVDMPIDIATPEDAIRSDHLLPVATKDTLLLILDQARAQPNPRPQRRRGRPRGDGDLSSAT